jgi:hypothetical protein
MGIRLRRRLDSSGWLFGPSAFGHERNEILTLRQAQGRLSRVVFRYTFSNVKRIISVVLVIFLGITLGLAEETSFSRVAAPDSKGRLTKAVLTFSDDNKAIEVQLVRGPAVSIPYDEIYKCSYEYTKKHRVNEETIFTAPVGVGAVFMLTKARSHWLKIDYREGEVPKSFLLRMDKHEYLHILDAVKAHTGKDAEVLGNADKR